MKNRKILLLFLLTLALAFAMVAGAGCAPSDPPQHTHTFAEGWTFNDSEHWHAATCGHSSERDSVAPHDIDGDGKCTVCDYETAPAPEKMTFEQLVADHKEELNEFVTEAIAPSVLANKEILSESRYVASAEDGNLGTVSLLYIYKNDETVRTMELAEVTLTSNIENKDISESKFKMPSVDVKTTTIFEFDAKENFAKQNIADLLYSAFNASADVKLFAEKESKSDKTRTFSILLRDGQTIRIKDISVEVEDNTDEALVKALSDKNKYDNKAGTTEYTVNGTLTLPGNYTLEEFDITPPTPVTPTITDKQVQEALEENCKDTLLNKLPTKTLIEDDYGSFDESKMSGEDWRVNKNEDGDITKLEYSFFYKAASNDGRYVIASMTFNTPVSREDFVEGNLPKATYKEEYTVGYNPTIQESRSGLANAILEACKGSPADKGSTVILVDNGASTNSQLGVVRKFIVVEINENGATEYSVQIKSSESDAQYSQEIENNQYAQTKTTQHKVTGDKLVAEEESEVAAEFASINRSYWDGFCLKENKIESNLFCKTKLERCVKKTLVQWVREFFSYIIKQNLT